MKKVIAWVVACLIAIGFLYFVFFLPLSDAYKDAGITGVVVGIFVIIGLLLFIHGIGRLIDWAIDVLSN